MKIYIPTYSNGWHVTEADSENARLVGRSILHRGTIYGEHAYITEAAAWLYIHKQEYKAEAFRFHFQEAR